MKNILPLFYENVKIFYQNFLRLQICIADIVGTILCTGIEILSSHFLKVRDAKSAEKFDKCSKMTYHFKIEI